MEGHLGLGESSNPSEDVLRIERQAPIMTYLSIVDVKESRNAEDEHGGEESEKEMRIEMGEGLEEDHTELRRSC